MSASSFASIGNFSFIMRKVTTRLMGGYASLRTSDMSDKDCGKDSSVSSDDGIEPLAARSLVLSSFRGHLFIYLHCILLAFNLLVALLYSPWSLLICSHGPQNHACKFCLSLSLSSLENGITFWPYTAAARDVIKFEGKKFELKGIYQADGTVNPDKPTNFNGSPRPELDKAWDDLIGSMSYQSFLHHDFKLMNPSSSPKYSTSEGWDGSVRPRWHSDQAIRWLRLLDYTISLPWTALRQETTPLYPQGLLLSELDRSRRTAVARAYR